MLSKLISQLFYFYYILIIIRILLSWVQTIDWNKQPFTFVRNITDPYLEIFRRFIPPLGMLDLSPIVALIALQILSSFIVGLIMKVGL